MIHLVSTNPINLILRSWLCNTLCIWWNLYFNCIWDKIKLYQLKIRVHDVILGVIIKFNYAWVQNISFCDYLSGEYSSRRLVYVIFYATIPFLNRFFSVFFLDPYTRHLSRLLFNILLIELVRNILAVHLLSIKIMKYNFYGCLIVFAIISLYNTYNTIQYTYYSSID